MRYCEKEDCYNKHVAKGLCEKHRWAERKPYGNRKTGKPTGRPPKAEYDWNKAVFFLNDGASYREVAYTLGIPRTSLREMLPGMGWTYAEGGRFIQYITNTPEKRTLFNEDLWDPKRRQP